MITGTKNFLRRQLRLIRGGCQYPVLMPQERVVDGGLQTLDRPVQPQPAEVVDALRLCDGTRTLAEVARESGATRSALLELVEAESLLMWRGPVRSDLALAQGGRSVRAVVVSPHPDDAPLCLGGMMLQAVAGEVTVLDVFTRTAWSRFPTELNDVARIQTLRWAEERLMSRLSGANLQSLDLPEALLRQHMFSGIFSDGPTSSYDTDVAEALVAAVVPLSRAHPLAVWYVPLAVGNHLDHRIVRDATLAALARAGVVEDQVRFYEDLPYAEKLGGVPDFATIVPGRTLVPELIPIDAVVRWKLELNRVYWTQFTWSQITKLRDYATRIGDGHAAERVWRLVPAVGTMRMAS